MVKVNFGFRSMKSRKESKRRIFLELLAVVSFAVISFCLIIGDIIPRSAIPLETEELVEARYWVRLDRDLVQCRLCFRNCTIPEGSRGYCGVRANRRGTLYTLVYSRPAAVTLGSPIEKLPFYHVHPGALRLNLATAGCNFKCSFCHNWQLSTRLPEEVESIKLTPEEAVELAIEYGLKFIAFTYNEPTVFYEYMYDVAKLAKEKGLMTLFNTNGAMNPEPFQELLKYLDAVNVDLKAFTADFYRGVCFSEIEPVLTNLRILKERGTWFEIVNLIIPTLNDNMEDIERMCIWIKNNLGDDIPVHFNRFSPAYKLTALPPTPVETLERAREIAQRVGLKFVYIGNVPGHPANNTFCPRCCNSIVYRVGIWMTGNLIENGKCPHCGYEIPGIWD